MILNIERKSYLIVLMALFISFTQQSGANAASVDPTEKLYKKLQAQQAQRFQDDQKKIRERVAAAAKQPLAPLQAKSGSGIGLKYAPGRLIVKFTDDIEESAQTVIATKKGFKHASRNRRAGDLDQLVAKYKVKSAHPLFRNSKQEARLTRNGVVSVASLKDHSNREAQDLKRKFPKRAKSIPKNVKPVDNYHVYVLDLGQGSDVEEAAQEFEQLKKSNLVEFAQPDYLIQNAPQVSDQVRSGLWGLDKINAQGAWALSKGEGVVVAVVDTGVDYANPEIAANIWNNSGEIPANKIDDDQNGLIDDVIGYDFTIFCDSEVVNEHCILREQGDADPMDTNGHGTHVAGTIAANGKIQGVAPLAKIMPIRVMNEQGYGYMSDFISGLNYAVKNGARVINNSWGYAVPIFKDYALEVAVEEAYASGVVVVFAAGNSNSDVAYFSPANVKNAVVVSALDSDDQFAWFSNYGKTVDVGAPGVDILSLNTKTHQSMLARAYPEFIVDQDYLVISGTSMATPHVAGAAALILSYQDRINPDGEFTNEDVARALRSSAADLYRPGFDIFSGFGRLDLLKSLAVKKLPAVKIVSPVDNEYMNQTGVLQIRASLSGDVKQYQLYLARGLFPTDWQAVNTNVSPGGELTASLDLGQVEPDIYWLRADVQGSDSNFKSHDLISFAVVDPAFKRVEVEAFSSMGWIQLNDSKLTWTQCPLEGCYNNSVYLYDLETKSAEIIGSGHWQAPWDLNSDGKRAVWAEYNYKDSSSKVYDVYNVVGYDFADPSKKSRILNQKPVKLGFPMEMRLADGHLIWRTYEYEDDRDTTYNLNTYYYNFASGQTKKLDVPYAPFSDIFEGKVHFARYINGQGADIYSYDLASGATVQLTSDKNFEMLSGVSDGKLVFWDLEQNQLPNGSFENKGCKISYFDLKQPSLGKQMAVQLPDYCGGAGFPEISGNKIVWQDYKDGNADIYLYDINQKNVKRITKDSAAQAFPFISGNTVGWMDQRLGKNHLFYYEMPNNPPLLDVPDDSRNIRVGENLSMAVNAQDLNGDAVTLTAQLADGTIINDRPNAIGMSFSITSDPGELGKVKALLQWSPQDNFINKDVVVNFLATSGNGQVVSKSAFLHILPLLEGIDKPKNLRGTALFTTTGYHVIRLNWDAPSSRNKPVFYRVYRDGLSITISDRTPITQCTDGHLFWLKRLEPNTVYKYKVVAFDRNGNVSPAVEVEVKTLP